MRNSMTMWQPLLLVSACTPIPSFYLSLGPYQQSCRCSNTSFPQDSWQPTSQVPRKVQKIKEESDKFCQLLIFYNYNSKRSCLNAKLLWNSIHQVRCCYQTKPKEVAHISVPLLERSQL